MIDEREKIALDTFANSYSEEYRASQNPYTFVAGVEWADEHPSDETINKILWIWTHSDISMNEEIDTNDYIREHWFDNFD